MRARARSAKPPYDGSRSRLRTRRPGSGLQLAIADLRRRGTESRAPRPDRPQALAQPGPGPGLDLAVPRLALTPGRLEVLEPRVRFFDHQQLFRLALRHVGPPGVAGLRRIVGPGPDGKVLRRRWYPVSRGTRPMVFEVHTQRARRGSSRPAVARFTEGDSACRGSVVGSNPTLTGQARSRRPSRPPLPLPQPNPQS